MKIVSQHPGISLADVYAALAYSHDHAQEIRRDIELDETLARSLQDQMPSRLLRRLARQDADADPIPPG